MPLFKLVLLICDQERNIRIPQIRDKSISNGQDRSREKVILVISETKSVAANTLFKFRKKVSWFGDYTLFSLIVKLENTNMEQTIIIRGISLRHTALSYRV